VSTKTVLLVEDSEGDIFIMQRAWQKAQFQSDLKVVTDGNQAIDYLSGKGKFTNRAENPIPCLILLDIKLPFRSGHEVVKWLREYDPCATVPVVFLTSSNSEIDIQKAYRLGGNAYLVKPTTSDKLIAMLSDLKEFWMKHNQFPPECLGIREPVAS
jgi:CheY-like chemotaxis protein